MYFKYDDQGNAVHYIDGVLRATIAKENFNDYKEYYPDCNFLA